MGDKQNIYLTSEVWVKHIGHIWANVLHLLNLHKKSTIIEIAPGSVNKIGYALHLLNFEGKLYVLEPNKVALTSIIKQYRKVLPRAKIIPINKTLKGAINKLPKEVDALISNHPLDDILLGKSLSKKEFDDLFNNHYSSTSPSKTQKLWKILKNKRIIRKIKKEILDELDDLFKKTHPKLVVISQYKSYFFTKNKIAHPDNEAYSLLKMIRKKYSSNDISHLLKGYKEVSDFRRWLILKNPSL